MDHNDREETRQGTNDHLEAELRLLKDLLRRLNDHAGQLEEDLEAASREIKTLRRRIRSRDEEINNLYASRSWRITRPVRAVSIIARSAAGRAASLFSENPVNIPGGQTGENSQKLPKSPIKAGGRGTPHRKPGIPLTPREKEILEALGRLMEEDRYGR